MYKRFRWILVILLNFVTCGIYGLIAWNKIASQQNHMAQRIGDRKIMGFFPAFLLGVVTLGIVSLIWMYKFSAQARNVAQAKGIVLFPTNNAVVLWLLTYVPVFSYYLVCANHNKLIDVFEQA